MKLPLLLALAAAPLTAHAANLGTAELTKAINDVRVLQPSKPASSPAWRVFCCPGRVRHQPGRRKPSIDFG